MHMIKLSIVVGLLLFLGFQVFSQNKSDVITSEELRGAVVVDVRSPSEFAAGHFDKAINIPLDILGEQGKKLASEKRPIVVYCRSGRRSEAAKKLLQSMGVSAKNGINQGHLEKLLRKS